MEKKEKVKVNMSMSLELKEWYMKQAESYGTSYSSMMVIALSQYKQQIESLNQFKDIPGLLEKLQVMQGEEIKKVIVEPISGVK